MKYNLMLAMLPCFMGAFWLCGLVFVVKVVTVQSFTETTYDVINQRGFVNESLTELKAESAIECAAICSNTKGCCSGKFNNVLDTCQLHENCCPNTDFHAHSYVIRKQIKAGNNTYPRDCSDISQDQPSGIYRIYPTNSTEMCVFCDMGTAGGGWTVLQRRFDGTTDFYRDWNDYKVGFGNVEQEHWLGNEKIYELTSQGNYKLRIVLEDFKENIRYAEYATFSLGDEQSQYVLHVANYSGNAGDGMGYHNGQKFSTKDRDNDLRSVNCADDEKKGGWWYQSCANTNLNGLYYNPDTKVWGTSHWAEMSSYDPLKATMFWYNWLYYQPMKKTTLIMKRV